MELSLFQSAMSKSPVVCDSEELWKNIKEGKWKQEIGELRETLESKGKKEYDLKKKELFAVTLSGLFTGRMPDTLIKYSGYIQGDIDKVEDPDILRDTLSLDKHVRAVFLSPSGRGVKVVICVDPDPTKHKESFFNAQRYLKAKYGVEIDPACKDIARLLFVSHDPELKGNEECVPLPEDSFQMLNRLENEETLFFDATKIFNDPTKSDFEKAQVALENISPDDYHTWFSVGCSLKAMLGEDGFNLWDQWSSKSQKYNTKEMRYKWDSISQAGGITGGTVMGLGATDELPPRPRKPKTEKKRMEQIRPLDRSLLNPEGFVGDWAEFVCQHSRYPQPELALANALALTSSLLGRKVRDQSDIRPNIYIISIAETAMGKEAARKFTKQVFSETGVIGFGAEKLTSKTAIERTLAASPNALYLIDEFSHYVASLMHERSSSHLRDVMTCFMELYSSSTSTYYGADKANAKENPRFEIDQPSASIYATTTGVIWDTMTSRALRDGTLNRFLIFNAPEKRPEINECEIVDKIPKRLTNLVHQYSNLSINQAVRGNLADHALATPSPQILRYDDKAKELFRKFEDETLKIADRKDNPTAAMWGRASELSKKVALIVAGAKFTDITGLDAEYGCELVRQLISNTCVQINRNLSDNDSERESKRVEQIIRNSGENGISASSLIRRTRFIKSRAQRKQLIDDLFESEIINKELRYINGSQRGTLYYFCE